MLRLAEKTDFQRIYEIYMDPSVNPFMAWEIMDAKDFHPIFDKLLATGFLHVYEIKDNLIAVIRLEKKRFRSSHVAYIGGFGVHPSAQNQGWGAKVLKDSLGKLKEEGIKRIELLVESDNPVAIAFYEKFGFQREGVMRGLFKRENSEKYIDDYFMALLL